MIPWNVPLEIIRVSQRSQRCLQRSLGKLYKWLAEYSSTLSRIACGCGSPYLPWPYAIKSLYVHESSMSMSIIGQRRTYSMMGEQHAHPENPTSTKYATPWFLVVIDWNKRRCEVTALNHVGRYSNMPTTTSQVTVAVIPNLQDLRTETRQTEVTRVPKRWQRTFTSSKLEASQRRHFSLTVRCPNKTNRLESILALCLPCMLEQTLRCFSSVLHVI